MSWSAIIFDGIFNSGDCKKKDKLVSKETFTLFFLSFTRNRL